MLDQDDQIYPGILRPDQLPPEPFMLLADIRAELTQILFAVNYQPWIVKRLVISHIQFAVDGLNALLLNLPLYPCQFEFVLPCINLNDQLERELFFFARHGIDERVNGRGIVCSWSTGAGKELVLRDIGCCYGIPFAEPADSSAQLGFSVVFLFHVAENNADLLVLKLGGEIISPLGNESIVGLLHGIDEGLEVAAAAAITVFCEDVLSSLMWPFLFRADVVLEAVHEVTGLLIRGNEVDQNNDHVLSLFALCLADLFHYGIMPAKLYRSKITGCLCGIEIVRFLHYSYSFLYLSRIVSASSLLP